MSSLRAKLMQNIFILLFKGRTKKHNPFPSFFEGFSFTLLERVIVDGEREITEKALKRAIPPIE